MQPPEEKSRIEQLKDSLYSRNAPDIRTRRKLRFGDINSGVRTAWERDTASDGPSYTETLDESDGAYGGDGHEGGGDHHSMSFFTKLFIFSILFCIVAVGIGSYLFYNGANLISADNIDIVVNGPVSVPGGTPVSFDLTITNKNSVDLQNANLSITYPSGSTDPSDPTKELTTYHENIGDIAQGQSIHRSVQAVMFGDENTQKTLAVNVDYGIKGSTSSFTKSKSYDILINSSPVGLTVSSFKEITSGQDFTLQVNVKSNSSDTLKNVLLQATYPFGFSYDSANVKPLADNATWRLGDLPPGSSRTITIHGKLQGEDTDTRVFHFSIGAPSSRNPNTIGTEYMSAEQEVAIQKPFISTDIIVDGKKGTDAAAGEFNQPVHVEINYFNNLSTTVSDAEIVVKLAGTAYDRGFVSSSVGYFRSSTDEIIWNPQTSPKLASIGPGESGTLDFMVTPRDFSSPQHPIQSPSISFSVSVTGKRTQESGVPQTLSSIASRSVNVSTAVVISGQVVRSIGPFVNTGPIPPKADQKTTYTIQWSIDNTTNPVHNAVVTAKLPVGVSWVGQFSPDSEQISYDQTTGIVTWNAGSVGAYTSYTHNRKAVAFQVSLEPNVQQVGQAPTLVGDASLSAVDDVTGDNVTGSQGYLTTRFSTDPTYRQGMEVVTQ